MCTPSRQWPLSVLLQRNRVVEVAGVDRVDRDRSTQLGQVGAARRDRFVERVGLGAGFVERVVGELARAG